MKNEFGREIKEGITLTTCCMDRNPHLKQVLPNWLSFEQIEEIVIVDWSSQESLEDFVRGIGDPRVVLARVEEETDFALAFPGNLAARLSSRSRLLKLDADTTLVPDFFERNPLREGMFYQGNGHEDRGLTGMLYVRRSDFFDINGFSEIFTIYGWEDTDIFNRLMLIQDLEAEYIAGGTAIHIAHDDAMRMARQSPLIGFDDYDLEELINETLDMVSDAAIPEVGQDKAQRVEKLRSLMIPSEIPVEAFLAKMSRHPIYNIMRNRHICEEFPWSNERAITPYERLEESPNFLRLRRAQRDLHPIPEDRMRAAKRYGLAKLCFAKYPALQAATKEMATPVPADAPLAV